MAQELNSIEVEKILKETIRQVAMNTQQRQLYEENIVSKLKKSGGIVEAEVDTFRSFLGTMDASDIVKAYFEIYNNPSAKMTEYMRIARIEIEQKVESNTKATPKPEVSKDKEEPKPKVVEKEDPIKSFLDSINFKLDPEDPIYSLIEIFVDNKGVEIFNQTKKDLANADDVGLLMYLIANQIKNLAKDENKISTIMKNSIKNSVDYTSTHNQKFADLSEYYSYLDQLDGDSLLRLFIVAPSEERFRSFVNYLNLSTYTKNKATAENSFVQPENSNPTYAPSSTPPAKSTPQTPGPAVPTPNPEPVVSQTPPAATPELTPEQNFDSYLMDQYHNTMGKRWTKLNEAVYRSAVLSIDGRLSTEERAVARKRYILLSSQLYSIDYELRHLIQQMKRIPLYQQLLDKYVASNLENVPRTGESELRPGKGIVNKTRTMRYNHLISKLDRIREKSGKLLQKQRKTEIKAELKEILSGRKHMINSTIRATNKNTFDFSPEEEHQLLSRDELEIKQLLAVRQNLLSEMSSGSLDRQTEIQNIRQSNAILDVANDISAQMPMNMHRSQKKAMRKTDKYLLRLEELRRHSQGYITGFQEYRNFANIPQQPQL